MVTGLPKTVELRDLEQTVSKIFHSSGFDIEEDGIEECHRLAKSDCTMVKFS